MLQIWYHKFRNRRKVNMKKILAIGIVFFLSYPALSGDRLTGRMDATRSVVYGKHGMVATSQPLAAQVGIDILKKGGSAVDAAIAVNATLGLMEPVGAGMGGDLFAIIWDAKPRKLYGLNASGPASRLASAEKVRALGHEQMPSFGGLPVTVPGCVGGWFALHKRFGKLQMDEILTPAIKYAKEGFPLTEVIAYYWKRGVRGLSEYKEFQRTYAPGGRIPTAGDVFSNPALASTLGLIAKGGRDVFYNGDIAKKIADAVTAAGGFMTLEDLRDYRPEWVESVTVNYRGYDVWELPPNGQGIAALQMLAMLREIDLQKMGHNSADYLHTLIEIKKIVYEDRARFYADPRFEKVNLKRLISSKYSLERLKSFNPEKALRAIPAGEGILQHGDTVYLTVADEKGNMVSFIQSNYIGFGSGVVPEGLGFTLQDRGALFSLEKGHPNELAPGKRPFHTIIPGFVTKDGQPVFSFGVMGGSMQPQGHVQILCNIIDFGMNIQEAGDAPRFRHGGSSQPCGGIMKTGGTVYLESGIPAEVCRDLARRGHKVATAVGGYGGYQGIWRNPKTGVLAAASESRKDGCAIGY